MKQQTSIPKLDPPGAGIPWPQKMILRYIVAPFVAAKTDWSLSEERFHKITKKILREIEGLSETDLSTKILVPPQRGLEDSSRYWSIAMVLEHLVIVGSGISYAITELSFNRIPDGKADTAAVKPLGLMSAKQSLEEFEKFTDTSYKKLISSVKDKNSKLKFKHPWFGMINAKQWFWVITIHHGLHLKQIREIKKRLPLVQKKGGGVLR